MNRLITLSFSHYNEKARWALDRFAVPYREERYAPFFSSLAVAAATRGRGGAADRASTRYSTPVLLTDDGQTLCDSTEIVRLAAADDESFFAGDETAALVDLYSARLGPATRTLVYWHVLRHRGMTAKLVADNTSRRQGWLFRGLGPLPGWGLRRFLRLTEANRDKAMARLREMLDETAARLETRAYLCGDRFTAADLTFAALLAPVLCVAPNEGYGAVLPPLHAFDAHPRAMIEEMRAHPAGQFALRLYAEERQRVMPRNQDIPSARTAVT